MSELERVLSISDAAQVVPLSESQLYKLAKKGEGPFTKPGGRWMTTHSDLIAWVRSGPKGSPRSPGSADPMPTPARGGRLREQVKNHVALRRME